MSFHITAASRDRHCHVGNVIDQSGMKSLILKTVLDGKSALEEIKNVAFDFFLVDLAMFGMSGFEVVKKIRAEPKHQETPILIITARMEKEDIEETKRVGANGILIKPFEPEDLLNKIRELLELFG